MRRILELESSPRGIYCGAIGRLTPAGTGAFNVAIRTLSHIEGAVSLGSGGGIVWDSDSAEEYREALLKSRFLSISDAAGKERASIEILETMRWEHGIPLRDRHLARLARTAVRLGFKCPLAAIGDRLDTLDAGLDPTRINVVRLLLGPDGSFRVETAPLDHDSRTWRIGISEARVHSGNPFLTVKTTYRGLHEAGRREAVRRGLDEVVFLNEQDELTEGTITNIFMRIEGDWLTPPLSSGLLPGLGREIELESQRHPAERVLRAEDLIRADAITLTNAVRGTIEAAFEGV
jgi:para-aminobenzoate synthetase/4-amino-4-deoxychorismate lyase